MSKQPPSKKDTQRSAARPRAQRLTSEARHAQIVQSAIQVFARRGIGHTNHSAVAAAAGVSLPAIFFYFPTHETLSACVLSEVARFLLDGVIRPLHRKPGQVVSTVEKTYLAFLEAIDSHPDHVRIWLDWSTAVRDTTWPQYLEFHEAACEEFRRSIERGQADGELRADLDARSTSIVLISFGHMIAHMKLVGTPRETIMGTLHTLIERYLGADQPSAPKRTKAQTISA